MQQMCTDWQRGEQLMRNVQSIEVLKPCRTLTAFRLVALTSNTRNEAGRAFEKKTAFEKSLLAASTLTPNCTPAQTIYPIPILPVVDRRPTESCVLNRRSLTPILDQGRLILRTRNSLIYMEPRPIRSRAPLTPSLMRIYQPFYLPLTSS